MTNQMTQVVGNQNSNTKETVNMTNRAFNFSIINSKEVTVVSTRAKEVFPVQVRMELIVGGKSQQVQFGYSRLGGRQTYVMADGKAPTVMSRADFLNKLRAYHIPNMKQVQQELGKIRPFMRDEFIVAKCECCSTGYVTAANIDFTQRNHEKLSAKLGRPVSPFSKICYKCQGHSGSPKTQAPAPQVQSAPPVIPAQAHAATCESCGKEVKSQKVAEFSVRQFGKVLCYKPCQSKYPKLNQPAPAPQPQVQSPAPQPPVQEAAPQAIQQEEVQPTNGFHFSPSLISELMALEVDPFSEIAQLQRTLQDQHIKNNHTQNTLWKELSDECTKKLPNVTTNSGPQEYGMDSWQYCRNCKTKHVDILDPSVCCLYCEDCYCDMQKNASEASVTAPTAQPEEAAIEPYDGCFVCDGSMPPYQEWSHDFCPKCTLRNAEGPEALQFGYPQQVIDEAVKYIKAASEASGVAPACETEVRPELVLNSPIKEEAALNAEDTKEVPPMESATETVCKSPGSDDSANGLAPSAEVNEAMLIFMNEILPSQEAGSSLAGDGVVPF